MQKTGQIERTVDREFADEESRYKQCVHPSLTPPDKSEAEARLRCGFFTFRFEKETMTLQKESKAYLEAMRGICNPSTYQWLLS